MPSSRLSACLDAWTIQAVVASRWLTRLYHSLQDDRQAAMATEAGKPALDRLHRSALQGLVAEAEDRFLRNHAEEVRAEEAAWVALIESLAGFHAFHTLRESREQGSTPGFPRHGAIDALGIDKALCGFRTAFPEEMVKQGLAHAIGRAASACVTLLLEPRDADPEQRDRLRAELNASLFESLDSAC